MDPFTAEDLQDAKCYLAIGKTGSGKTTVCNAISNWAWNVEYRDLKRFKLIHNELEANNIQSSLGCSMTFRINAYFLRIKRGKFRGQSIVLLDTPGFADVNLRDDSFKDNMYNFLKNTDLKIQGICFTV